jgi:hypothetical protein
MMQEKSKIGDHSSITSMSMEHSSRNYQRTPGQILSLTSSIKFSESLTNYDSPEYGRKSSHDASNLSIFKLKNQQKFFSNTCKQTFRCGTQQQQQHHMQMPLMTGRLCPRHSKLIEDSLKLDATTNSSKIHKNIVCQVNESNSMFKNNEQQQEQQHYQQQNLLPKSMMTPENNNKNWSYVTEANKFYQTADAADLGLNDNNDSLVMRKSGKNFENLTHSAAEDVCQRRQTPLRWSKTLKKQKGHTHLLLQSKDGTFKPPIKGILASFILLNFIPRSLKLEYAGLITLI